MVRLSASKISTFESCSWLYYVNYILKVRDNGNDGSKRGSIIHTVLECLLNSRHKKYSAQILTGDFPVSIKRLIIKHANKVGIHTPENLEMMGAMIETALSYDFYCEGSANLEAETEFNIENGKYHINGFIDKRAVFDDKIDIHDYKSSKQKYNKEEINFNLQNLMYCLATYKEMDIIPQVTFHFLKFKKSPLVIPPKPTDKTLKGFELYLEYLTKYLNNFTHKKAMEKLASYDVEKNWKCGRAKYPGHLKINGEKMWYCPHKFPYKYFSLINKSGEILKSSRERADLVIDDPQDKIIDQIYSGCPAHFGENYE